MKLFKDIGGRCPKCTSVNLAARFIGNKILDEIIEEYIWWTCNTCGYSWCTHPADFDDLDHDENREDE